MLKGYATPQGTERFKVRFEDTGKVASGHFRTDYQGLNLSSLGMGTYLGDTSEETDEDMKQAALASVQSGAINVLDTAINYRHQCSERSLANALKILTEQGHVQRDELFLCSKNGFLTPDAAVHEDFQTYFQNTFIKTGIIKPEDIAGGIHCMSPSYLAYQLDKSLANLGVETLDLMYLHNAAESQLAEVGREVFMQRLSKAFEFYETARQDGKIRFYGLATWNCFRVDKHCEDEYLNLETVVDLAESIGGEETHGFRYIQLPYNLALPEALTQPYQRVHDERLSLLHAASDLGMGVFTSVPLMQGQLLQHPLPVSPSVETPVQYCLQFVRSTPGIIAPLVGHKNPAHVSQNIAVAQHPPLSEEEFQTIFLTTA